MLRDLADKVNLPEHEIVLVSVCEIEEYLNKEGKKVSNTL